MIDCVELINEFSRVIGHKINIQKSIIFLNVSHEQKELKQYRLQQHDKYEILKGGSEKICEACTLKATEHFWEL